MKKEDFCFTVDIKYPREELADLVYAIDADNMWDSYMPPDFDATKYDASAFDAVSWRYKPELDLLTIIQEVKSKIKLEFTYKDTQIVSFPPNHGPVRHRDCERETGILFPIWTFEDYKPITFWHDNKIDSIDVDYKHEVLVMDAHALHAIDNGPDRRYSLQFDIQKPFSEVLELHKNGDLFV